MADEVKDALEKNARGPRSVRGDLGEVQQHSIPDQIEADRYLAARQKRRRPYRALRFARITHGGAV